MTSSIFFAPLERLSFPFLEHHLQDKNVLREPDHAAMGYRSKGGVLLGIDISSSKMDPLSLVDLTVNVVDNLPDHVNDGNGSTTDKAKATSLVRLLT